jgi:hypothetical protein
VNFEGVLKFTGRSSVNFEGALKFTGKSSVNFEGALKFTGKSAVNFREPMNLTDFSGEISGVAITLRIWGVLSGAAKRWHVSPAAAPASAVWGLARPGSSSVR